MPPMQGGLGGFTQNYYPYGGGGAGYGGMPSGAWSGRNQMWSGRGGGYGQRYGGYQPGPLGGKGAGYATPSFDNPMLLSGLASLFRGF
jgi:hypothetical protein